MIRVRVRVRVEDRVGLGLGLGLGLVLSLVPDLGQAQVQVSHQISIVGNYCPKR